MITGGLVTHKGSLELGKQVVGGRCVDSTDGGIVTGGLTDGIGAMVVV